MISAEWTSVIVSGIGLGFVFWQLRLARKALENGVEGLKHSDISNRLSREMFVLELRNSISLARSELSNVYYSESKSSLNDEDKKITEARKAEKEEELLNRMDHLYRCFRLGFVDERDYRSIYFDKLKELMKEYSDFFKPGHKFPNIQIVFERWRDNKKATDSDILGPGRAVE